MARGRFSKWVLVILCTCAFAATAESAQVIYVDNDAAGAGNGSSWQNACVHLQDALALAAAAAKPVEIRVAGGIYRPDRGAGVTPGDQTATFQLLNGVTLKGGYAGATAPDPDARDVDLHETILSGDLKGNDVEVNDPCEFLAKAQPTWADNSAHVVIGSGTDATAGLDGFTITAGCTAPSVPLPASNPVGAGMYNEGGSPNVRQCIFRANFSFRGGAVYNHGGSPTFSRCTFERNGASFGGGAMSSDNATPTLIGCTFSANVTQVMGQGGAVMNEWYAHAVLKDCAFAGNESKQGGAIHNDTASVLELYNCRFDRNRAISLGGTGGAIFNDGDDLTMTGCTFDQNSATRGGGAVQTGNGTLLVSHCAFTGNTVDVEQSSTFFGGGAIRCEGGTIATLADTKFEGNLASNGGAIYTYGYYIDVTRCSFVDNVAWTQEDGLFVGRGGALHSEYAWVHLTDCTFDQNRALKEGGAFWSQASRKVFLARCDFTGNDAEQGGALCADNLGAPLANCLFSGNRARQGGAMFDSSGGARSMRNCTFAGNSADDGPTFACDWHDSTIDFSHCILWDGPDAFWSKYPLRATVTYSDVQGGYEGEGNIDIDPCFVNPGTWSDPDCPDVPATPEDPNAVWIAGDYHLRSQAGHWDRQTKTWIRDDQTSLCIDTGNPSQPFNAEPFPNGGLVNLGAYGGTAEASKSYFGEPVCDTAIAGDINGDCKVDSTDQDLMMRNWLVSLAPVSNQPPAVVISQPLDGAVIDAGPSNGIISIVADAVDSDGSVAEVRFFVEYRAQEHLQRTSSGDSQGTDGWQWSWNWQDPQHPYPEGQYTIYAYAIDDDGALVLSPKITVTIREAK